VELLGAVDIRRGVTAISSFLSTLAFLGPFPKNANSTAERAFLDEG